MKKETIVSVLCSAIREKGLKQAHIAEKLPFSQAHLSGLLRQEKKWSAETWDLVREAAGFSYSDLFCTNGQSAEKLKEVAEKQDDILERIIKIEAAIKVEKPA